MIENGYFSKLTNVGFVCSPEDANCIIFYSCVAYDLLKACKHPAVQIKNARNSDIVGIKRVAKAEKRKVSYFEEDNLGLVKIPCGSDKYYWVSATRIIAYLKKIA